MATARSRWLVAVTGLALIGAGCGSSPRHAPTHGTSQAAPVLADPSEVAVIRGWSSALRHGDVAGAARYFALPSEFANGAAGAIVIHTETQARAANASLPCGAVLLSATRRGRFVSALFRLTDRSGPYAGCGPGAGALARTNFVIVDGHIVDWIRAPEGSGGSPGPAAPPVPQGPVV
ncbi:MAG TPA: hypothetical protein VG294_01090 [Solirubrobacteraceae bacterium]|jgi:hypothetical protein|nr:hypothetical protein [Solirubrobacteraceae bacterium]